MRVSLMPTASAVALLAAIALAGCAKKEPPPPPPSSPGTTTTTPSAGQPGQPPPPPGATAPSGGLRATPAAAKGNAVAGKTVFSANCAVCHGPTGSKGKPNFTNAAWQKKTTDQQILKVIQNGTKGMPPFGKKLSAKQQTDTVAFIRTLSGKK